LDISLQHRIRTMKLPYHQLAVVTLAVAGMASSHALTTINFDNLSAYTTVSNQYAAQGVIFSPNAFSGAGSSNSGQDWATNTNLEVVPILPNTDPNYDHGLLGNPALASGMILRAYGNFSAGWLAEDGDASFLMTFTTPISSISMVMAGVAPIDELQTRIWAYNGNTLLGSVSTQDLSNLTTQQTLSFAAPMITSVAVRPGTYFDYVAVDNISFQQVPIPEPGTWALMALGLVAVAGATRRRG
jgi:PEP-CTERM motif